MSTSAGTVRAHALPPWRAPVLAIGALALLATLTIGDVLLGPAGVDPLHALRLLFSPDGSADSALVQSVRLPRAISGLAVGAALGVAGALLQAALRNALADPSTVGINSGASLGVTLAAVVGMHAGDLGSVPFALAGAALAAAIVLGLGGRADDPVRLVLAGVAVAFSFEASAIALQVLFATGFVDGGLLIWGAGSIEQPGWAPVRTIAPVIPLVVLGALAFTRDLDALTLGDEHAESLGVRARRTRFVAVALAVVLAAAAVALAGPLAFVGLAAPHLVRRLGANRGRGLLLGSAVAGAGLVLCADMVALAISGDLLKTGVICTLAGAPLLVAIARRVAVHPSASALRDSARGARRAARRAPSRRAGILLAGALLLVAFVAALSIGDLWLGPADVLRGLFGQGSWALVVQDLRLPRAAVAAAAGVALALSGVLLQGVVRNPLAGPELLGVSGGASVAAVAAVVLLRPGPGGIALAAFVGGVAALALVFAAAPRNLEPTRVALIGVAIASACIALSDVLVLIAGPDSGRVLILLNGSTYAEGWGSFAVLAPVIAVCGLGAWMAARRMDALGAGDDMATTLGVAPVRTRLGLLLLSAAAASSAVAIVGNIAFVGLMAPHAARLLVGPEHRRCIPVTCVLGAAFLLLADLIGRSALPSSHELPSGLVTAIIGGPVLLLLLRRA